MKNNITNFINGTSALKIDNDFYSLISRNRDNAIKAFETNNISAVSNIYMIQQIYVDLIKNDNINIAGINLKFSDDEWSFADLHKDGKSISLMSYRFVDSTTCLSNYYQNILKLFVMYLIYEYGLYRSSNKMEFLEAKHLFEHLQSNNISSLSNINTTILARYFARMDVQYNTVVKRKSSLKSFFYFFSLIAENIYTQDIETYLSDRNLSTLKAIEEENKTKLLPTDFMNEYKKLLKELLFDDTVRIYDRALAGLLYIGTQTGLRSTELCLLTKDCLKTVQLNNQTIGIIQYRSTKNGGTKNDIYTEGETNASEDVINVINQINNLLSPYRCNCEYLVFTMGEYGNSKCTSNKLISTNTLDKFQKRLCIQYRTRLKTVNREDKEDFGITMDAEYMKKYHPEHFYGYGLTDADFISCPHTRQFRVYFASELHERGVDYKTISYLLNHKTEEMWGYYVRPKHKVQEDIDFSKEVVAEIIKDNTKILGPKGDAIREKIDQMIKENNFNVVDDFEAIIDMVCNEMPIRAKEGGFCIKSNPRRQCRHDADTDEFLCAYGCCPNHCHFYFSAHISYKKCVDIKKCADYNNEQGYRNQAQKELYKLDAVIKQELLPELEELEVQLKKKPVEKIVEIHPDLEPIISNLPSIRKEIEEWKNEISKI